jgi:hypothetical protein
VTDLGFLPDRSVDFVFASILFEYLTLEEFATVLEQLRAKLKRGGTLNILQPNYRFAHREYFDDYNHISIYSNRSLKDFLTSHGFRVIECKPRFLPLTIKSGLPVSPFLVRLYLALTLKPGGNKCSFGPRWKDNPSIPRIHPVWDRIRSHMLFCWLALLLVRMAKRETGGYLAPAPFPPRPIHHQNPFQAGDPTGPPRSLIRRKLIGISTA